MSRCAQGAANQVQHNGCLAKGTVEATLNTTPRWSRCGKAASWSFQWARGSCSGTGADAAAGGGGINGDGMVLIAREVIDGFGPRRCGAV